MIALFLIPALYVVVPALALLALALVPSVRIQDAEQVADLAFVRALRDMHAARAVQYANAARDVAARGYDATELLRQAVRNYVAANAYNRRLIA